MASKFPKPIFLDLEGNVNHFAIPKQRIKSWTDALRFLEVLLTQEHAFHTVVLDSVDQLELYAKPVACKTVGINNINEGYGKGLNELTSMMEQLRSLLERLSEERKMHIVLIAHSKVQQIDTLGELTHHKISPSLHERVAPLFTDWCNIVGYAHLLIAKERDVQGGFNSTKTIADIKEDKDLGSRVLQVESTPQYVAKNVFDFPTKDGKLKLSAKEMLAHIKTFYEQQKGDA
jgi:hypothetical protein